MSNGYIMVIRDRMMKGIYVETTDDWEEYMSVGRRRLIYCQAVSDVEIVQEKIDQWLEENDDLKNREGDINETVAEMISSIQWIANEHPLKGFRHCLS